MNIVAKLEKRFHWLGVPNLSLYLVMGQVAVYLLLHLTPDFQKVYEILGVLSLSPQRVIRGEVWRLVTFLFIPPINNFIFVAFGWYLFYLMGTALEGYWGTFRYTLYLLVGYLFTVGAAFLLPDPDTSNAYLAGTVFLAFAYLNPFFVINIFFVLPVQIKWLALLTWLMYFYRFAFGDVPTKLAVIAATANFFLFFGKEIFRSMRSHKWRMERRMQEIAESTRPRHQCIVCGATERSHPDYEFRYCTKCTGRPCYCMEHLAGHTHT